MLKNQLKMSFEYEPKEKEAFIVKEVEIRKNCFKNFGKVRRPSDLVEIVSKVLENRNLDLDNDFYVLLILNTNNLITRIEVLGREKALDFKEIYRKTIINNACNTMMVKIQKGDCKLKSEDKEKALRLNNDFDLLGIDFLDFLVLENKTKKSVSLSQIGLIN